MLYSLGQHAALQSVQDAFLPGEQLFAFLDDIYVVCLPERVAPIHKLLEQALEEYARIQVHLGKTQVWNRGGHVPPGCDAMQVAAQIVDPDARVWRGDGPSHEQGIRVLGIPVCHVDYVQAQLQSTMEKHRTLFIRLQSVQDLQSAWLLLLFCANTRATCSLRGVPPAEVVEFAATNDEACWQCLMKLLNLPSDTDRHNLASLPFSLVVCGLRSAWRTRVSAHWASWADSLRMIRQRRPEVANTTIRCLSGRSAWRHLDAAAACREELFLARYSAPDWSAVSTAQPHIIADHLPGVVGIPAEGWQHDASSFTEQCFFESSILPGCTLAERALLRSQGGPLAALPCTAVPVSPLLRFDPNLFRVLFLRGVSGSPSSCLPTLAGVAVFSTALATSVQVVGFALESAAARVCREGGAIVSTNVFLRDLDLVGVRVQNQQRIEVIAEGLPVLHGVQLAIDTTLVSPIRADGEPHRRCAEVDGAALEAARRRKERTYPELAGGRGRAKLVVFAGEIGGRFSEETQTFLRLLARAKTRAIPEPFCALVRGCLECAGGILSWPVLQPGRLVPRRWIAVVSWVPMVRRPRWQTS